MNIETFKKVILDSWISEDEPKEVIQENYKILNDYISTVYDFVLTYYTYMNMRKDYGVGDPFTMVEAHVLTDIADYPGITVTELAKKWRRTSSAISQTTRKLMKNGYIRRENSETDGKVFYLYTTDLGEEFVTAHKSYDVIDIIKTNKTLAKKFTPEEIIIFNEVLKEFTRFLIEGKPNNASPSETNK